MTASAATLEPDHHGRTLHARLVAGDRIASSEIALRYLPLLVAFLARKYPSIDEHLREEAAGDAILALIGNPASYDPARMDLLPYLRMSAAGDLLNAIRGEARHSRRRANLEAVELSAGSGNYAWDGYADPERIAVDREAEREMALKRKETPASVQQSLTEVEASVLALMREGERMSSSARNG